MTLKNSQKRIDKNQDLIDNIDTKKSKEKTKKNTKEEQIKCTYSTE